MPEVKRAPLPPLPKGVLPVDPFEKFQYLNVLFHSYGGLGKTTCLTSACYDERTAPILVGDLEGGASLRFALAPKDSYQIWPIKKVADINDMYTYLKSGDHPYKSAALDSVTEIQKLGLSEFVYGAGAAYEFMDTVINLKSAEIQHWGKSANQMGMMMRYFRDLKMHIFFTTLTIYDKDEVTGRNIHRIALPGKQADEVPGIPDIVGYITQRPKEGNRTETERVVAFQPTATIVAKDRTDSLGAAMVFEKDKPFIPMMLDTIWKHYGIG